jgi:hypothetical protein
MDMESLWQIAVSVAGIGAVGCLVFYSLYRDWLRLRALATLTRRQRFVLFIIFLVLTFAVGAGAIVARSYEKHLESQQTLQSANELISILEVRHSEGLRKLGEIQSVSTNPAAVGKVIESFSNRTERARTALKKGNHVSYHEETKGILDLFESDAARSALTEIDRMKLKVENCDKTIWPMTKEKVKK